MNEEFISQLRALPLEEEKSYHFRKAQLAEAAGLDDRVEYHARIALALSNLEEAVGATLRASLE